MQTHFNSHTLAEIFRDLYLTERRGVLTLASDEVEKRVFLDHGLIFYADSNAGEDDLGARLIEEGKISSGALEEARQNAGNPIELPQVLVSRDLISREALNQTLLNQIRAVVRSTFGWNGGRARFHEGPPVPRTLDGTVVTTSQFILDGIAGIENFDTLRDALIGVDRALRLSDRAPLPIESLPITSTQGFILSRLDGTTTFRDMVSLVPPGDEEGASRFIYGLLVLGVLEFDPPVSEGPFRVATILREHADRRALEQMQERTIEQTYTTIARQDPYEILGIDRGASRETIDVAYEEAKGLFGQDRILPSVRTRLRTELAVIESRLIEAYLKLSHPEPEQVGRAPETRATPPVERESMGVDDLLVRVELDKTKGKLEHEKATKVADSYFAQARRAIREGDFHNAIQYGKLAVSYNDKDARYYFLLAECQARNPGARWQHLAEQNYTKASQLDPWNVDYCLCLGRFYKRRGLKLRARKQFEEALRLHPQHDGAVAELKSLD